MSTLNDNWHVVRRDIVRGLKLCSTNLPIKYAVNERDNMRADKRHDYAGAVYYAYVVRLPDWLKAVEDFGCFRLIEWFALYQLDYDVRKRIRFHVVESPTKIEKKKRRSPRKKLQKPAAPKNTNIEFYLDDYEIPEYAARSSREALQDLCEESGSLEFVFLDAAGLRGASSSFVHQQLELYGYADS